MNTRLGNTLDKKQKEFLGHNAFYDNETGKAAVVVPDNKHFTLKTRTLKEDDLSVGGANLS